MNDEEELRRVGLEGLGEEVYVDMTDDLNLLLGRDL